jgi:hypothetical protein
MIFELLYISIGIGIAISASFLNSAIKDTQDYNMSVEDLWSD